jgi:hypothetical protein
MIKTVTSKFTRMFACFMTCGLIGCAIPAVAAAESTIVITAIGMVDPEADAYKRDRMIMVDALRADAKKQCVEKAVGSIVSAQSLVENYVLLEDRVFTRTEGLIRRVINEESPVMGSDGLMRMEMTAEVYLGGIEEAIRGMSRIERIDQIKQRGNPSIAVSITVQDATRRGDKHSERSMVAENILKQAFSDFGYRVWSEGEAGIRRAPDFRVTGEAEFTHEARTHSMTGVALPPYMLVSWTVTCEDAVTGEQIYFNTQVPRGRSWSSEASALEGIGKLIGEQFNQSFFDRQLMKPSNIYQLYVHNVRNYDQAEEIRRRFLGLREIINADLEGFDRHEGARLEIDVVGGRQPFMQLLNNVVVRPLNEKYGSNYISIISARGAQAELEIATTVAE